MSSKRGITKKLSKNDILALVTQEEIFAYYLSKLDPDLTLFKIQHCVETGKLIRSPLRVDKEPTVGFKYTSKGKLRMRDFAGYFYGDVFDLVGYLYQYNTNTKSGFYNTLKQIYHDLNLQASEKKDTLADFKPKELNLIELVERKTIFDIQIRDWTANDLQYWGRAGITYELLNYAQVYPVQQIIINPATTNKLFYTYRLNNPAYAYYEGVEDNIQAWRIYFPETKGGYPKFIANFNRLQGMPLYKPKAKTLIITKSYKDILAMISFFSNYYPEESITFIAPPAENYIWRNEEIALFKRNHKYIFSLYDFDYTGVKFANRLKREHQIQPIFITNGKLNTVDFKAKDFFDLVVDNNIKPIIHFIVELKRFITDETNNNS